MHDFSLKDEKTGLGDFVICENKNKDAVTSSIMKKVK